MSATTTGTNNVAVGRNALDANTTASNNTAVGADALGANTTGADNTSIGYASLAANTEGTLNTASGSNALRYNTTGSNNTAHGRLALYNNTTGTENTATGKGSLQANTTASYNTAVGSGALGDTTTGASNTAVGRGSLNKNTTGHSNTAVGYGSLDANTTATDNTAVGLNAMGANTTGNNCVAVGSAALDANTSGAGNTAVGQGSLGANTTTSYNAAFGAQAARVVTGERNVYLGYDAGAGVASTATGNIIIGMESRPAATTGNYEIVIGYGTTGKGGQTGFINPIGGGVYQGNNSSTWSTTSDRRLKKNIADSTLGLAEINQIQVRNFEYRNEDEITELPASSVVEVEGVQIGVIAQEIQAILPDCVKEESTGVLSVDPNNLTWYMIKAIQELSAQNAALTARIEALES